MSDPIKMPDLAYEGFPKQIVDEHGDVLDGITMQYLSALDCDGKELCEGDIVRLDVTEAVLAVFYLVEYQANVCSYAFVSKDDPQKQVIFQGEFKIVGNEHQFPGVLVRAKGGETPKYPH